MVNEKRNAYVREWNKRNPEKVKKHSKDYWDRNPTKKLLKAARNNAKAKEREFNLSESDIIVPALCIYLGVSLTPDNISIDRIDSNRGYVKGNIQVISKLANLMKSSATQEQLCTFAKNVLKIHECPNL